MNYLRTHENQLICSNRSLAIYTLLIDHIPAVCNTQSMSRSNSNIRITFPSSSYVYGISIVVLFNEEFDYEVALLDSRNEIIYDESIGYSYNRCFPSADALIYEVVRLSLITR